MIQSGEYYALKTNHQLFYKDSRLFLVETIGDGYTAYYGFYEEKNCGHGRIEDRTDRSVEVDVLGFLLSKR